MNYVRKLVGFKPRPGTDAVSQSNQDDELCLRHLRKLYMEFRHSSTPMTIKEQDNALYRMLPLFCKIFAHTKPSSLTEKFGDACQFAAHISQLMVREIRKRSSDRNHEAASNSVMEYLLSDSVEDSTSGWKLLSSLNILACGESPVVECMVAASLPSTLVKCLCLFFELTPAVSVGEKSVEDQEDDRVLVQKIYTQVLVNLCNSPATCHELVNTDDLSVLFSAISCPCSKYNLIWRGAASEILMTLMRYGLNKSVLDYICKKNCIQQCVDNMRRIQAISPIELVKILVTLVCCLKESSNISHQLLADFRNSHGYLFLCDLLLMLSELEDEESREACRNVVLLVSQLVLVGHVHLRPLVSIGAPFQDPAFTIPEPIGKGVSVRNIEAFQVLQTVFLKTSNKQLSLHILDSIYTIYDSDPTNYFILEPQHTLSLFIEKAPEKDVDIQERIFKLLELVICSLNWVPCPELISVSILFKNKVVSGVHQVALSFLIRILSFEPKYKDVFREVGVLEVLTSSLKGHAAALKEANEALLNPSASTEEGLTLKVEEQQDYAFLLMSCLRLLLEGNPENAKMFRACGGARCAHNMIPQPKSRTDALRIIQELLLSGGNDDLGTLLGLMHSTPLSEVALKIEVLNSLLRVFELEPNTRAVFREVGGFVYVMSVPLSMEGSLSTPPVATWANVERDDVLMLLRTVFHVLTAAMQDEPANKNYFMDEVRFRGLADTIRLLGCYSLSTQTLPPNTGDHALDYRHLTSSSSHPPLTPTPSSDSVRSSVMGEVLGDPDLDSSSVLYAANEMFKCLFEMATDSFGLKAGNYGPTDQVNGLAVPHYGSSILSIYHAGAITAVVDLLPAVCQDPKDDDDSAPSEDVLDLQRFWLGRLQSLLRSEHNQQVMCQAGLPQQLLQRCEAAFVDENHPLNPPLQRMFERLASQALTPTVLRDFLRLGNPLLCKPLEPLPEQDSSDSSHTSKQRSLEELGASTEEGESPSADPTDSDTTDFRKLSDASLRKLSDAVARKVSDVSGRSRGDSRVETLDSQKGNISFRDVMMSMMQPSSESGSSSGECSDSENEPGFEIVADETPVSEDNPASEDGETSKESISEDAPAEVGTQPKDVKLEELNEDGEILPTPPPRHKRRKPLPRNDAFEPAELYGGMVASCFSQEAAPTTVVDGVDIDTVGDSEQEVSSIDQGDDMVIVDVTSDVAAGKSNTEDEEESENQELDSTRTSGLLESLTDNDYDADSVRENTLSPRRSSQGSIASSNSADMDAEERRDAYQKATEMSVEDIVHSMHIAQDDEDTEYSETSTEINPDTNTEMSAPLTRNAEGEGVEEEDGEEDPPAVPPPQPVPLTRVKCLVSMTTPRDARAHGVSYSPAFVEFDMSKDGFGCLFLPAIAPQALASPSVSTVVGTPVAVVGSVPGVGTGERVFPPQAGLTFATWICIDRYSRVTDDPHPVRLLTVARQFRTSEGKSQASPCLSVTISAKDKMLVICTDDTASDDMDGDADHPRREREHTEARFLSDLLLEEGRWHHMVLVLNKALIRNSTATLFVDGQHVATNKLKYIQGGLPSQENASTVVSSYLFGYIGTPPSKRRCSRLLWRLGPAHLIEEPLTARTAMKMFLLGPNYVGSFQSPCLEGDSVYALENADPLVSEDKVMFGVHAHAQSVLTMAKMRKHFRRPDTRAISRELGLSTTENTTPVRLIHNTAAHLLGPSRTIGAVIIGCSGVRSFCPSPVTKLMECIGGVSCLLGLIAMAKDVDVLYASVKALSCVLRSNPAARRDMERTRGYQILAFLLRKKQYLLNTHILHLTFALVGTVDSDRESSIIPNRIAFRDLLCDLEVWHDAPADLERSLYSHFLELLGPGNESQDNADLMHRLGLVPKLLFALQDDSVTDATAHTIASVLSVLLSNVNETKNLLRFGQFLASTLPPLHVNENNVIIDGAKPSDEEDESDGSLDGPSPRRISLRNVLLELVLCLVYGEGGSLDHRFADALQETLGFDWLMLFLQPHLHNSTVVRATRILVTLLGSGPALERFREGAFNGGWLAGTDIMLMKTTYQVAGFNVGAVSDGNEKYEICKEISNIPGFLVLCNLLPRHVDIPEIYHLLIALLLGHPVSEVYAGAQFDWHNLYSVFWSSSCAGVKTTPPSPRDPAKYTIYCSEAASVLLSMAKAMVNEAWEDTEEGSWLREYPVTLIQFLLFLYNNVQQFGAICTGHEFLESLVAVLFPKRRRQLRSRKESTSDSDKEDKEDESSAGVPVADNTLLITHLAYECIFDFLRVVMTDGLTCTPASKGQAVIDNVLEAYPSTCSQPQQAEYQSRVLKAQMDYLLGGNLLTNPTAGAGNHSKIVANVFAFASKLVDKLWLGNFTDGYKTVFNFSTSVIEAVKGQSVPLESIYHSLNRTILYQLSRPLARLTDQTSLLEFLHILTTNNKLVFAPCNNEPEFIAGLCHWLLVMGTQKSRSFRSQVPSSSTPTKEGDNSVQFPPGPGSEVAEEVPEVLDEWVEVPEEESSCTRLLAAAAERVWDIFLKNKREAIDDTFKVDLPKPSFTSYSPREYSDFMPGGSANLNLDLKSVRPLIGDAAMRLWVSYVTGEEKHKAETLSQQKPKPRRTGTRLTTMKKTKKESRDLEALSKEAFLWIPKHIKVVRDLVRLHYKNHQQNYQLISKSIAEEWSLMERDLTRERGLWGPPHGSRLDKWALDMVEGPHRMRKKMCRNELFYVHYPYDPRSEKASNLKTSRNKRATSADSKAYYLVRGKAMFDVGPFEAVAQQPQALVNKKAAPLRAISTDPGYFTSEANEESEVENQTIVKLLEAGERIRSMYRCARVQGLDTAEGLFLFGKEHFYVVDGVTLLSTKEIKDIDSLPPATHEPIIPRSSHDITKSYTKQRMCSKWAYEDIREVHKRRYLLQQTALEVFSSDGRNHFLVFPKPVRNKVYEKLVTTAPTLLDSAADSVSGMKRDTDVEAGLSLINTLMGERSVTQRWERGEITNFHYLMNLNTLAGRSYNDLMQYPVFPWVLADYDSEELDLTNPKTFRDFSKPMGAQGANRLEQILKRYREWDDPHGELPPYHYCTHYSSAMIVASYLIRMEPFSQHFLRLQGGHFDLPDRLFHSVKDAWLSAAETNMSDVKELIPEFFYLPEFLTNQNNFDLGAKQNGERLDHVILPPWAKNDPREFIRLHRKALECDYVSARLHEWIDLIFGYRQQGAPAIESTNVFHHLFYEGNVDISGIDDQVKKTATIGFINNFGQTPKQLFKRPHPQKKVFRAAEADLQLSVGAAVNVDRLFFHNLPNLVPSAQPVKELKGPVGRIIQSEKGMLAVEQNKVLIPPHYNRYVAWGFGDLSMRMGLYDTDKIVNVYENFHIGQVLCAACPDSRTLITGGTSTLVCVWDLVKPVGRDRKPQILLHEVLYGHQSTVTCLAVSTAYNLIVSGSEDQTCIIWDLNKLSYVTQLSGHAAPITAIAINDLTGDIATCAGTHLYVWSVNGQLIVKENTDILRINNHIQCCAMSELSGWDEKNVILTGSLDGVVKMWGIEFYNEAEKKNARHKRPASQQIDKSPQPTPPTKQPTEKPEPEEAPSKSEEIEGEPRPEDAKSSMEGGEGGEERVRGMSKVSQASSNLDEEYVIIDPREQKVPETKPMPVWRRKLVLRHKLTMHTAFDREDNMAPASVTSLLISKDHRKLFVGDGRGRIYSWSVTDAAGRMPADHWIKDEGAETCCSCKVKFTFSERRHHCRDCGRLFCQKCSKYESSVLRLQIYRPVRVCKACYQKLRKEQSKS
ncbi:WD repeat and FYVE domain-containing protein 3-like [Nematostella vectensis]|uniref:WD repeat and FYVE domain-containing protein 3-like n=1 Tax=Nematostella vectensis TaxID=45351 RepID=UPI0020779969|nr:WD repeat and FYVE domain-containing protein 3-like [Nematostella vectensis]